MFWAKYERLCKQRRLYPSIVAEEIGLARSSATGWKKGNQPTDETLQKLADYFGVDVSYFTEEDSFDANDTEELLKKLHDRPELSAMLRASSKLTPSDILLVTRMMEGLANAYK